jgi:hypothetical protein
MTTKSLADTYCVRPTQQGNGDGLTWTNAKALSSVISDPASRGHTYYVSGESYGELTFSAPAGGTSRINIIKATTSDHVNDNGWDASWGTKEASFTNWVINSDNWYIDGQVGGGPGSWNTGHGFNIYSTSKVLVTLTGSRSDINIRHTKGESDRTAPIGAGVKGTTGSCSNITISYCQFGNIFGVIFHINNWSNATIEYSYFYANKSTEASHSEGISSIGTNSNITIRYNLWDSIEGTAVFAGVNVGRSENWQIYGNIFSRSVTVIYYYWEVPGTNQNDMINSKFLNNTIVSIPGGSQGGVVIQSGTKNTVYNNIWYKNASNSFSISGTHDYNYAGQNIRIEDCSPPCDKNSDITGGESHGQIGSGDPFVNYNPDPLLADFTAHTQTGLNTNSLVSGNSVDMLGKIRGADGTWDRGALEFIKKPFPPTNIKVN